MNLILGTLMIFSSIILAFFGLPVAGLFIMSMINPAKIQHSEPDQTLIPKNSPEFLSIPITMKKVWHKGHIIWVDA